MKLKSYEVVVIIIALAVICFTVGFFAGRGSAHTKINIETQEEITNSSHSDAESDDNSDNSEKTEPKSEIDDTADTAENSQTADKININTASGAELESLPHIGEVLAGRIIDYRTEHGNFKTIEEILNVSGIGESTFGDIEDLITVG